MTTLRWMQRISMAMITTCALLLAACDGGGGNNNRGSQQPLTIAVDPASISLGQSATLTWNAIAGSTCTASGAWSGDQGTSGSLVVTPTAVGTLTYTLSCAGGAYTGGAATQSTTLTVTALTINEFSITRLVGDTAANGPVTVDPNLVNPWGIAFGPDSPVWVANNLSDTSTLYDGNGTALPLVVNLPDEFEATGMVFNNTSDFIVTSGANSAPANFIFAGESGMLAGWAQAVSLPDAITVFTADDEAMYLGLAIANNGSGNFLYAADFRNGKVDVFDATFTRQSGFAFTDANLPAGYAPFGIQALNTGEGGATQIYVAYAQRDTATFEEVPGAGLGLVNVFDTNGNFIRQFIPAGGLLNAPWGIALAPADYGTLSNAVLVGNFGDGTINGYNVGTGAFVGTLADSTGAVFQVPGLWGIAFGNDAMNQPHNTLFYAAGTNDEVNGEYGRIDHGAAPPVPGEPPVVTIAAPAADSTVSGTVTVTANVTDSDAIEQVEFFANDNSIGVVTTSPYSIQWDTTQLDDGSVSLTATTRDANQDVGTSAAVAVTVENAVPPPPAATLTQLQSSVFTPRCTSCHNGSNSGTADGLPGIMNLTAGNSFAALVGVASIEQPSLQRVAPGNAENSYIIHKLEGRPGITGVRMPQFQTPLDQATIDQVKSWINDGAPNN